MGLVNVTTSDEIKEEIKAFFGKDMKEEHKINITKKDYKGSLEATSLMTDNCRKKQRKERR